jgi:hypothetical protein
MAKRASFTANETIDGIVPSEKLALFQRFLASKINGEEEEAATFVKLAQDPAVKDVMVKFEGRWAKAIADAKKEESEGRGTRAGDGDIPIDGESIKIKAKKAAIIGELNRELAKAIQELPKQDHTQGVNQALSNAIKEIQKDPELSKDKEFLKAVQATGKNFLPEEKVVKGFNVTASHDNLFNITRSPGKKWLNPVDLKETQEIIKKHLIELYKHLDVSCDHEMIKADAEVLSKGRIPPSTHLAIADGTKYIEKRREQEHDLEKVSRLVHRKGMAEEFRENVKSKGKEMMENQFPKVMLIKGDKATDETAHYCFKRTASEKMDVARQLVMDLKASEIGIRNREQSWNKALRNAETLGGKDFAQLFKTAYENEKTGKQSFGHDQKVGLLADGYQMVSKLEPHQEDISCEVSLLEKGKKHGGVFEVMLETHVNAESYGVASSAITIAEVLLDKDIKSRQNQQYNHASFKQQQAQGKDQDNGSQKPPIGPTVAFTPN